MTVYVAGGRREIGKEKIAVRCMQPCVCVLW